MEYRHWEQSSPLKRLKLSDVREWHSLWVKTVRPIIVIAGDTDGSDIVSLLSAKLGLSGKNPVELPKPGAMKQPGPLKEKIQIQIETSFGICFWGPYSACESATSPFDDGRQRTSFRPRQRLGGSNA